MATIQHDIRIDYHTDCDNYLDIEEFMEILAIIADRAFSKGKNILRL
jgi:hypothetical protein